MDVKICPDCWTKYDEDVTPHECPPSSSGVVIDSDGDGLCDTCGAEVDED